MSIGNEPAYPVQELNSDGSPATLAIGLTKRELFAAMAMQGIMANPSGEPKGDFELNHFAQVVAIMAVRHADALLAQLSKAPQP